MPPNDNCCPVREHRNGGRHEVTKNAGKILTRPHRHSTNSKRTVAVLVDMSAPVAYSNATTLRPIGEVVAPIIKRLAVDLAHKGVISRDVTSKLVGLPWLRGA